MQISWAIPKDQKKKKNLLPSSTFYLFLETIGRKVLTGKKMKLYRKRNECKK